MSTALSETRSKPSAIATMAERLNIDPQKLHQTLKATVFKGASDEEYMALVMVSNRYDLDPITKQIYAFPGKGGGIVPVVSVDGWLHMVNSHPQMDGLEFEFLKDDKGRLEACTCRIYRKDRNRPIEVTEYLSECRRNTEPWKMEHRMLRHKALMQCARYAFGFSGITDEDEAANTPGLRDVTPPKNEGEEALKAKLQESATTRTQTVNVESEEEAPAYPDTEEMKKQIRAHLSEQGLTIPQATELCRKLGYLPEKVTLAKATDAQFFEITQNLDKLVKPEETLELEQEEEGSALTRAFFASFRTNESKPEAKKPWKLWRVELDMPGGASVEAVTFSETHGELIESLEDGDEVFVVLKSTDKGEQIEKIERGAGR